MSNGSIRYFVPLIPHTSALSSWFAAAKMVRAYRRPSSTKPPRKIATTSYEIFRSQTPPYSAIVSFARLVGLQVVQVNNLRAHLASTLQTHGPLWHTGHGQSLVITGVSDHTVFINDPLPLGKGTRRESPSNIFLDDLAPQNTAAFLYMPQQQPATTPREYNKLSLSFDKIEAAGASGSSPSDEWA